MLTPDGTRLAYLTRGAGEPMLMIAGLGYASWSWSRQLPALAEKFQVITVDNRGTGASDKPSGPYSIALLAEDMVNVLDVLSLGSAHVVGASMGGYIAMSLARQRPDLVRSLTLIATACGGPGSHGVPDATKRAWAQASGNGPEAFARATMPLSFRDGWTEENPSEYQTLLQMRLHAPTPQHAWAAQYQACEQYLQHGEPGEQIRTPTLVLHGTHDRIVPFANAALIASTVPSARLVRLDRAGHLCWIEQAQRVNDLITEHAEAADDHN
ncbi:MAG: alpha/beta fold hydrolase [Jatrophihabitantaceae bacterium]